MMEWTFGWWQISIQRVYPTTQQLSQTYNQAAFWWHQHLLLLGYSHAYRTLWRSLKETGILSQWTNNARICDCGIGTAALSLSLVQALHSSLQITTHAVGRIGQPKIYSIPRWTGSLQ